MTFDRPSLLWLAAAAPLVWALLWQGGRRRAGALERFAGRGDLFPALVASAARRRRVEDCLAAILMLLLAGALAGPRLGDTGSPSPVPIDHDVVIALDLSRSMLAGDGAPTRLDQARRELLALLGGLSGRRVGLVAFAGGAGAVCPLTTDYDAVEALLRELSPNDPAAPGTRLEQALEASLRVFDPNSRAERTLVLVSDGEETGAPLAATGVERLRLARVRTFAVGVGTSQGAPVPARDGGFTRDESGAVVLSRLREAPLRSLAEGTGGGYLPAGGAGDALATRLGARGEAPRGSRGSSDRYRWPLAVALLLLALDLSGGRRLKAAAALAFLSLTLPAPPARAESAVRLAAGAAAAYEAGRPAEAEVLFLEAQVRDPLSAAVAYNLGNTRYRLGRFEEAIASYRVALRTAAAPLRARALYNMGNAAFRLGRFRAAEESFRRALALSPGDADARRNLALTSARIAAQGETKRAAATPRSAGRRRGDSAPRKGSAASAATRENRGAPSPAEHARRTTSAAPADPTARRRWAEQVLSGVTEAPFPGAAGRRPPPAGAPAARDW